MSTENNFSVTIEKMAIGGAGVARHDGLVIFVKDAAPGDELLIQITLKKKTYAEARIVQILKPSPSRRTPPCPVAGTCGGCNWQHLDAATQLAQKQLLVKESLDRFLKRNDYEFLPIVPSPKDFRYRNRIQPKIGNGSFGFYARDSHQVIETADCLISEEALAAKMPEVRQWALSQKAEGKLEMFLTQENQVQYAWIEDGQEGIGFSQVNRFQNQDLIQTALAWSQGFTYQHIYDLYAGSGNFTFPMYQSHRSPLTAVELSPQLVQRAQKQIGQQQIQFIRSDVERYMKRAPITTNDLVVLDPPRAGCSEAIMHRLAQIQPQKIIYISCHPVSLARDLKWFFEQAQKLGHTKLRLKRVQCFEMFPQTDHVETIAELGVDS